MRFETFLKEILRYQRVDLHDDQITEILVLFFLFRLDSNLWPLL